MCHVEVKKQLRAAVGTNDLTQLGGKLSDQCWFRSRFLDNRLRFQEFMLYIYLLISLFVYLSIVYVNKLILVPDMQLMLGEVYPRASQLPSSLSSGAAPLRAVSRCVAWAKHRHGVGGLESNYWSMSSLLLMGHMILCYHLVPIRSIYIYIYTYIIHIYDIDILYSWRCWSETLLNYVCHILLMVNSLPFKISLRFFRLLGP